MNILQQARDICGLRDGDWSDLSEFYLRMQIAADRIAQKLPEQEPEKAVLAYKDELESQFPTPVVDKIIVMALLMHFAWRDMPFETFTNLGKPTS